MRDIGYRISTILGLIFMIVIKWTLQLDVFGYANAGYDIGMTTVVIQDIVFLTIIPTVVLIVAILLTPFKTVSKVFAIVNIPLTLFVLIHNTIMFSLLFMDTDVFWSRWIYLINIIPLIMTIIHIIKVSRRPKEGLVSYDI